MWIHFLLAPSRRSPRLLFRLRRIRRSPPGAREELGARHALQSSMSPRLLDGHFEFLRKATQDNFAVRTNEREQFRAGGAEPIMNDFMGVVGSVWHNGEVSFGQMETKEFTADLM